MAFDADKLESFDSYYLKHRHMTIDCVAAGISDDNDTQRRHISHLIQRVQTGEFANGWRTVMEWQRATMLLWLMFEQHGALRLAYRDESVTNSGGEFEQCEPDDWYRWRPASPCDSGGFQLHLAQDDNAFVFNVSRAIELLASARPLKLSCLWYDDQNDWSTFVHTPLWRIVHKLASAVAVGAPLTRDDEDWSLVFTPGMWGCPLGSIFLAAGNKSPTIHLYLCYMEDVRQFQKDHCGQRREEDSMGDEDEDGDDDDE